MKADVRKVAVGDNWDESWTTGAEPSGFVQEPRTPTFAQRKVAAQPSRTPQADRGGSGLLSNAALTQFTDQARQLQSTWATQSKKQRLSAIENATNCVLTSLGVPKVTFKIGSIQDSVVNTTAEFVSLSWEIHLKDRGHLLTSSAPSNADFADLFGTIAHEVHHAYQVFMILRRQLMDLRPDELTSQYSRRAIAEARDRNFVQPLTARELDTANSLVIADYELGKLRGRHMIALELKRAYTKLGLETIGGDDYQTIVIVISMIETATNIANEQFNKIYESNQIESEALKANGAFQKRFDPANKKQGLELVTGSEQDIASNQMIEVMLKDLKQSVLGKYPQFADKVPETEKLVRENFNKKCVERGY